MGCLVTVISPPWWKLPLQLNQPKVAQWWSCRGLPRIQVFCSLLGLQARVFSGNKIKHGYWVKPPSGFRNSLTQYPLNPVISNSKWKGQAHSWRELTHSVLVNLMCITMGSPQYLKKKSPNKHQNNKEAPQNCLHCKHTNISVSGRDIGKLFSRNPIMFEAWATRKASLCI